jgi:natural product precursor
VTKLKEPSNKHQQKEIKMKQNNPLKKLTLSKATIAHLNDEQMDAARGGSTGETGAWTPGCQSNNNTTC